MPAKRWNRPPPMTIDENKRYSAVMHTEKGDITIELFPKDAPVTVNNFVFLAREGYYDGVTFHRVIPGCMAPGGDPTGTGSGGPGYSFKDEFSDRKHETGTVSMANAGPHTNGSQFFICYAPQRHLDGRHTIFGRVTEGMDVVRQLRERDPGRDRQPGDTILGIDIIEE
jgi:cyclophilin family peptidyl-prolyl cis-trans isomerase